MSQEIINIVRARVITEVLHFTTSNGVLGILNTGALLSHAELPNESRLSYILQINCKDRSRDKDWHNHVNLSISRINGSFFNISRNKWHPTSDIFWCILSFRPEIMTHDNVFFSTTNNAYDYAKRIPGQYGLEELFQPSVRVFENKYLYRTKATPDNFTTCPQAEVLYPGRVPLDFLNAIYFNSYDDMHEVEAQIAVCAPNLQDKFALIVAPSLFT